MGASDRRGETDSWDDRRGSEIYAEVVAGGVVYRTLASRLAAGLPTRPPRPVVVDLATGTGVVAAEISRRAGRSVRLIGVDRASSMLDVARASLPLVGVEWIRADPHRLPLAGGAAGGVTCSAAVWHFPALARVHAEVARVLAGEGVWLFNVPASQLAGASDLPPAPVQIALARAGERRFGRPPAPAGPILERAIVERDLAAAGFAAVTCEVVDIDASQREWLDLVRVPAIGARLYPDVPWRARAEWIAEVEARIDPAERVRVRWWQWRARRAPAS